MDDLKIIISGELNQVQVQSEVTKKLKNISAKVNIEPKYSKNIVNYYKDLQKQRDSFNAKNLNGVDLEIKRNEEFASRYTALLKSQMQEAANQQRLKDSFHSKNMSAIDMEIKKSDEASKRFAAQLRSQMQEEENEQKQKDSFYNKNMTAIDLEIKKREDASKRFAAQLKEQMQLAVKAEEQQQREAAKLSKDKITNTLLNTNVEKIQQQLLGLKNTYSAFTTDKSLMADWNQLFDKSKIVSSQEQLRQLRAEVGLFQQKLTASGKRSRSFFDELGNSVKKFTQWFLIGGATAGLFRMIRNGVQDVKDLDLALTTVNMTMPTSASKLQELGDKSIEMGRKLGATAKDVLSVAQIYANMNETVDGILEKSKPTVLLSTASGLNSSAAADNLQAAMYQFELAEDQAQHIVDVYEKVSASMGMEFGRGINEIAEGIKASGSVAKEAGYDLEEYVSLLGSIIEKTRLAGSQVGNSFKMIFARLGRANTGDASEEDVSKTEKAYKEIGIALRDMNGEFKDIPDVLDELSAKWNALNSVQKTYIAEQSAGVRQKNIFLTMMNQYARTVELTADALDAQGFAEEANEVRMDSIDAKAKQLQASLTGFWTDFISSDAIKYLTDIATGFVDLLGNVTKLTGALPILAAALAGIMSTKNVGKHKYAHHNLTVTWNELDMNMVCLTRDCEENSLKWCA